MRKLLFAILMFISTPLFSAEYLILNQGQVTSWQHRRFAGDLAELDPIFVPQLSGNRYALPIEVLSDPNFQSVWAELSEFPVMELSYEDFQEEDTKPK